TAVDLSTIVPSPSEPNMPAPQQVAPPVKVIAHVWNPPAEMAATEGRPERSAGVSLAVFVPMPSCPYLLSPQHWTVPAFVNAHVCTPRAEPFATPELRPDTSRGMDVLAIVPSPSCPKSLYPQHSTPPAWSSPAFVDIPHDSKYRRSVQWRRGNEGRSPP